MEPRCPRLLIGSSIAECDDATDRHTCHAMLRAYLMAQCPMPLLVFLELHAAILTSYDTMRAEVLKYVKARTFHVDTGDLF